MTDAITLFEKGYLGGGVSLIFNSSNQTTYKTLYGMQFQNSDTDVLMHAPDYGEMRPVQATDLDRVFFFELNVEGTDNDAVANAVARLMRWVDGANQPALRYHMIGDAVELRLRIQLDGATNYTESSVKWGFVDAGAAWFNAAAIINDMAYGVIVALHLPPYSEGASISLTNYVSNGDFLVESSTSGLAQDWSSVGTPSPTLTLDTTTYLVNGVSQKVVTDNANNSGVMCATITAATTFYVAAFAWIYVESGGDPVTVIIRDGSGTTIDSAKTSDAGLLSITDRNGNTWVRVEVSGSEATNADCKLRIIRATSDATVATTFYVDACYVEVSTAAVTVPAGGWSSYYSLDNRGDETNAAMGQRNWLDLALIPGDAPALVRQSITPTFGTAIDKMIAARVTDGKSLATNQYLWVDSDLMTGTRVGTTNAAWTTGTGTNGNHYYRLTASGGTGSGDREAADWAGSEAADLYRTARRVYGCFRSSSTNTTFTFSTQVPTGLENSQAVSVSSANVWELIDLGTLNGVGAVPDADDLINNNFPLPGLNILVQSLPNGGTADIDFLWMPWAEEYIVFDPRLSISTGEEIRIDGWRRNVQVQNEGEWVKDKLGTLWEAMPGLRSNRFTYAAVSSANVMTLTDAMNVTLSIIPRTRQLLGTI